MRTKISRSPEVGDIDGAIPINIIEIAHGPIKRGSRTRRKPRPSTVGPYRVLLVVFSLCLFFFSMIPTPMVEAESSVLGHPYNGNYISHSSRVPYYSTNKDILIKCYGYKLLEGSGANNNIDEGVSVEISAVLGEVHNDIMVNKTQIGDSIKFSDDRYHYLNLGRFPVGLWKVELHFNFSDGFSRIKPLNMIEVRHPAVQYCIKPNSVYGEKTIFRAGGGNFTLKVIREYDQRPDPEIETVEVEAGEEIRISRGSDDVRELRIIVIDRYGWINSETNGQDYEVDYDRGISQYQKEIQIGLMVLITILLIILIQIRKKGLSSVLKYIGGIG